MRSAMEHKHPDVQFILDALARILVVLDSEGDLLFEDDHFESFKRRKRAEVRPTDAVLAKVHQARAYVFSNCVLCLGGGVFKQHVSSTLDDLGEETSLEYSFLVKKKPRIRTPSRSWHHGFEQGTLEQRKPEGSIHFTGAWTPSACFAS